MRQARPILVQGDKGELPISPKLRRSVPVRARVALDCRKDYLAVGLELDARHLDKLNDTRYGYLAFEQLAFSQGLEAWMRAVFACNAYVDVQAPWALRKTDTEIECALPH